VVGVHVQVDVDHRAARRAPLAVRISRRAATARRPPRAHRRRARAQRPRKSSAAATSRSPARVGGEAGELRGERVDVAGLEQQPALAFGEHLLVDGQARAASGYRAGADRLQRESRRGAAPAEASTTTSASRAAPPARPRSSGVEEAHARAQLAAQRTRLEDAAAEHRRLPVPGVPRRRSARRKVRSAARSSASTKAIRSARLALAGPAWRGCRAIGVITR
jgi:hypothetical protein